MNGAEPPKTSPDSKIFEMADMKIFEVVSLLV